jgi:hypothetical protein
MKYKRNYEVERQEKRQERTTPRKKQRELRVLEDSIFAGWIDATETVRIAPLKRLFIESKPVPDTAQLVLKKSE